VGDGCTTTPAIQKPSAQKTASTPLQSVVIQVAAIPPNTTGIGALPDLEQNVGPLAASLALYSSKPNDSTAMEALLDQTIGSTDRSPESCIGRRDWCGCCQEPANHEHLNGSRRLKAKRTSHTKRPSNKKPPPEGWLNQRSLNGVKAQ
jgi:hypothetical protein